MRALIREPRQPESPLRKFFDEQFQRTAFLADATVQRLREAVPLVPAATVRPTPYSTLGTAIDYRLRYYFQVRPVHRLDAHRGARWLTSSWPGPGVTVPLPRTRGSGVNMAVSLPLVVHRAFQGLETVLAQAPPVRRRLDPPREAVLCRYCFILALLEEILRNPGDTTASPLWQLGSAASLDDLLALVDSAWVEDLCRLSWRFADRCATFLTQPAWFGPRASSQVGGFGASADLLVGGCLIELKTTIRPVFDRTWLYQVLGYVLLDQTAGQRIGGIGFYFPRQGVLLRWGLATVLPRLTDNPNVRLADLRELFWRVLMQMKM